MSYTTGSSSSKETNQLIDSSDSSQSSSIDYRTPRPSDVFFKQFECPICLDFFIPPVVHCPNEHFFCLSCIERQALTSTGYKCSICRKLIDPEKKSRKIEEQLEELFLPCIWREKGCKKMLKISKRSAHQSRCKFSGDTTSCYFSGSQDPKSCSWTGTPYELVEHLTKDHSVKKHEIQESISFVWDFPKKDEVNIQTRVLDLAYPGKGTARSLFFLEFYYDPEDKYLLFAIRTVDGDIKLDYSICFHDRKHGRIYMMLCRKTLDFGEARLDKYPNCDVSNICYLPYEYLDDIKVDKDGMDSFSFSVRFMIED